MDLKTAYTVQSDFADGINVQAGYTQTESKNADKWVSNIAHIAAHLGWDHEIITNFDEDEHPDMFNDVPSDHIKINLFAWYECMELIETNRGIKMTA